MAIWYFRLGTLAAIRKAGRMAYLRGEPVTANPYKDDRSRKEWETAWKAASAKEGA